MNIDAAINAFATSSGVTADRLSLLLRTMLCGFFLLWAAWHVYGQLHLVEQHRLDIHDLPTSIFRIFVLMCVNDCFGFYQLGVNDEANNIQVKIKINRFYTDLCCFYCMQVGVGRVTDTTC